MTLVSWLWGVCWLDFDNDGREDVYVANMWSSAGPARHRPEQFFMHRRGPRRSLRCIVSMPSGNSLFHNEGDGRFRESTETRRSSGNGPLAGLVPPYTWDFDHDGFPDLYVNQRHDQRAIDP